MISNNLMYTDESEHQRVAWCVNLEAVLANLEALSSFPSASESAKIRPYHGPAFFINGALSVPHPAETYTELFPSAEVHEIAGAGHYV